MHLTNYTLNKMSADFVQPAEHEILTDNQGSKRTLQSLYDTLSQEDRGIDVNLLKERIADVCSKVMQIYGPMIEN